MKNTTTRTWMAAATTLAGMSVFCAPASFADDSPVHALGTSAQLTNGDVVQEWTVAGLKPSSDVIPYPVTGTLWEATASDSAVRGTVTPIVSNFNARSAASGQSYRVLFAVATPQGVNPATLPEGATTTGKLYFDITGGAPDSIVYNAGGPDLAVWVSPPPAPTGSATSSGSSSRGPSIAGAVIPGTPTPPAGGIPAVVPAAADAQAVPLPAENGQATPIPGSSSGTPLPSAGTSQGTPIVGTTPAASPTSPAATSATPAPAAAEQPAASQGTPVPATSATPLPTTTVTTPPTAAGQPAAPASQGTPVGQSPASAAPTTTAAPAAG